MDLHLLPETVLQEPRHVHAHSRHLFACRHLNQWISILALYMVLMAIFQQRQRHGSKKGLPEQYEKLLKQRLVDTASRKYLIRPIEPLTSFDYNSIIPNAYRPFKTKRHVVMGLNKIAKIDSIKIDQNYRQRIYRRKNLILEHPDITIGTSIIANPAIAELYEDLMLDFLPCRYPSMFRLSGLAFTNLVTQTVYSVSAARGNPAEMLRQLGENVEEDFYWMCPDGYGEYLLQGYISCFPQGLLSRAKVGLSTREIHRPVPGYEQRLGNGVDRCFARMTPGNYAGRLNWSIQINGDELYLPMTGNTNPGKVQTQDKQERIDFQRSFLRVEHHTLHTLPRTGAIVFAVRTYLTGLGEIKTEGSGGELADAIKSMPERLGSYKNRDVWGERVCGWLRQEE